MTENLDSDEYTSERWVMTVWPINILELLRWWWKRNSMTLLNFIITSDIYSNLKPSVSVYHSLSSYYNTWQKHEEHRTHAHQWTGQLSWHFLKLCATSCHYWQLVSSCVLTASCSYWQFISFTHNEDKILRVFELWEVHLVLHFLKLGATNCHCWQLVSSLRHSWLCSHSKLQFLTVHQLHSHK